MKFSNLFACFAAFSTTSVLAAPVDEVNTLEARNLPGLTKTQSARARAIIAEVEKEKLGRQGCLAGITTGLTESSLRVLANKSVPRSLDFKRDGLGSDHDSVGIFQQRAMYYPHVKCSMHAQCSARQFFTAMKRVDGWRHMNVPKLCQEVQVSAYPDAYQKYIGLARRVCTAAGH